MMISNLLPHLQTVSDELCFIKSMHTEHFNHAPAQLFSLTGFARFGRPSVGSWLNYGLGSENENLPGFVVLNTGMVLGAGNSAWGSGFLPSKYQGTEFRSKGDPVLFLSIPSQSFWGSSSPMGGINHPSSLVSNLKSPLVDRA